MRIPHRLDLDALRGALPDFRDIHIYGGAVIAAAGLEWIYNGVGIVAFGVFMAWIGLRVGAASRNRRIR